MPRKKKRADELTTEEAMAKMFPKKVRDEAKKAAAKPRSPARLSIDKKDKG
ncbi:MAG: hypothetical protein M3391_04425 [Actinomycetota bacterium]|nr:hypothetical protein [Actinomycetota bacterium]